MNRSRFSYYRRLASVFWSYKRKKTRLSYLPLRLWIEPTSVCNLRCVMCPNKELTKDQKGFMDFALFRKIVDEVSGFAFDVHLLHRGESLLHPEFFDMVKYAHDAGLVTRFHTNGTLLDEEKSRKLIAAGLDQFAVSIDGFDAETYERVRVNADFEKTIGNIVRFLEIKKELGADKPKTLIEFIDQPGLKESAARSRRAFEERFKGLPLDRIVIKEYHNWAGDAGEARKRAPYSPCTFLWHALIIFWDGAVLPCTQDFFGYYTLGNVKDESVASIWNNERWSPCATRSSAATSTTWRPAARATGCGGSRSSASPKNTSGRALLKKME